MNCKFGLASFASGRARAVSSAWTPTLLAHNCDQSPANRIAYLPDVYLAPSLKPGVFVSKLVDDIGNRQPTRLDPLAHEQANAGGRSKETAKYEHGIKGEIRRRQGGACDRECGCRAHKSKSADRDQLNKTDGNFLGDRG